MLSVLFVSSDCIGSTFNSRGSMQCPNCRRIERGNWLYAGGAAAPQHESNDDWVFDEDLDDPAPTEFFVVRGSNTSYG